MTMTDGRNCMRQPDRFVSVAASPTTVMRDHPRECGGIPCARGDGHRRAGPSPYPLSRSRLILGTFKANHAPSSRSRELDRSVKNPGAFAHGEQAHTARGRFDGKTLAVVFDLQPRAPAPDIASRTQARGSLSAARYCSTLPGNSVNLHRRLLVPYSKRLPGLFIDYSNSRSAVPPSGCTSRACFLRPTSSSITG